MAKWARWRASGYYLLRAVSFVAALGSGKTFSDLIPSPKQDRPPIKYGLSISIDE